MAQANEATRRLISASASTSSVTKQGGLNLSPLSVSILLTPLITPQVLALSNCVLAGVLVYFHLYFPLSLTLSRKTLPLGTLLTVYRITLQKFRSHSTLTRNDLQAPYIILETGLCSAPLTGDDSINRLVNTAWPNSCLVSMDHTLSWTFTLPPPQSPWIFPMHLTFSPPFTQRTSNLSKKTMTSNTPPAHSRSLDPY